MDMHPPPAYVQVHVQLAQAEEQSQDEPEAPVEPAPTRVDITQYIPAEATSVTILLSLTPPTGQALVYTEGNESSGTIFKGGRSVGDIRIDGPYIYVKLYGATSFNIQYINYHVP